MGGKAIGYPGESRQAAPFQSRLLCPCPAGHYEIGQTPTIKEAQAIADEIFSDFVSEEVDKVELIYTKFVSLISSGESAPAQVGCCGHSVCKPLARYWKLVGPGILAWAPVCLPAACSVGAGRLAGAAPSPSCPGAP